MYELREFYRALLILTIEFFAIMTIKNASMTRLVIKLFLINSTNTESLMI